MFSNTFLSIYHLLQQCIQGWMIQIHHSGKKAAVFREIINPGPAREKAM